MSRSLLNGTLCAEEDFNEAMNSLDDADPVKRAWAWLVGWQQRQPWPTPLEEGRWLWSVSAHAPSGGVNDRTARNGHLWRTGLPDIDYCCQRLSNVQLPQRDGIDVMMSVAKHPHVDMYCDPPYPSSSQDCYSHTIDIDAMTEALLAQQGRVLVSGLGDEWDHLGWRVAEYVRDDTSAKLSGGASYRTEKLWMNYDEAGVRL